jgi:hypothetical protein
VRLQPPRDPTRYGSNLPELFRLIRTLVWEESDKCGIMAESGRGCGVGRGLGVTLGAGVADGVSVGVGVSVAVGLGVGVE